jgi:hypothetical protein
LQHDPIDSYRIYEDTTPNNKQHEHQRLANKYAHKPLAGTAVNKSASPSDELIALAKYNHVHNNVQLQLPDESDADDNTEPTCDKTDTEVIYDKTDTEVIYDKTDTEVVYDRTDTELRLDNELILDGTDTEATLETDISFHNDRFTEEKKASSLNRYTRSSSDPYQSADVGKGVLHVVDADSELSKMGRDSIETDNCVFRQAQIKSRHRVDYETDEMAKTEDDLSVASFAVESEKSTRHSESEGEVHKKMEFSASHQSDEVKTEDDFSSGSFDRSSVDENQEALDELHGMT